MNNDNINQDIGAVWRSQTEEPLVISTEELRRKAHRLELKIRWRNAGEYGAAVLIIAANIHYFLHFQSALLRIGSALIVVGVCYAVWQLHRHSSVTPLPANAVFSSSLDYLIAQLRRQRDLLRRIWSWYLLPLFPGVTVFLFGLSTLRSSNGATYELPASAIVHTTVACVIGFALIAALNHAASRKLQRQIEFLGTLRKT